MNEAYRLTLYGRGYTREITLGPETRQLIIGTDVSSDVRLARSQFFLPVELTLVRRDDGFGIFCGEGIYLTDGTSSMWQQTSLSHGDCLQVCYQASDVCLFRLEFMLDLGHETKDLRRRVDLSDISSLSIGSGPENDLRLGSWHAQGDHVLLQRQEGGWRIAREHTRHGVFLNGQRAHPGALIGDMDHLWIADYGFCFSSNAIYMEARSDLVVRGLPCTDSRLPVSYPGFTRSTRLTAVPCQDEIAILDPPVLPTKESGRLLQRMLPAAGMIVTAGAMALIGGSRMIIFTAISAAMAVITSIVTLIQSRRSFRKRVQLRDVRYREYIADKRRTIELLRAEEKAWMEEMYLPLDEVVERILSFSPGLFDRRLGDQDLLCVRLGSGPVRAKRTIGWRRQEKLEVEDELSRLPEETAELYEYIREAPVILDLKTAGSVCVHGGRHQQREIFRNMLVDLCARHDPVCLRIIVLGSEENRKELRWVRPLSHIFCEELGTVASAVSEEAGRLFLEYLYKQASDRQIAETWTFHIVVLILDDTLLRTHPVSRFMDGTGENGIHFVYFKDEEREIPPGCQYVVELGEERWAELIPVNDKESAGHFVYPWLAPEIAERLAIVLSPVRMEEIALESALPARYSLFEMLNVLEAAEIDLSLRWSRSSAVKSLAAPIGISAKGTVTLDVSDRADGPHGLVAGTTGSGKSEILLTYILSMASLYHPEEVGFVIIDFKGGGMAGQLVGLPHLLGTITNIDERSVTRSLRSIRAELQKRQRLFAQAEVNHIDRYMEKAALGQVSERIPHLIIIVDEFAELKAEQPEFMKELISAARIGRSLGVHLILATQKPSGQVSEQIWSNSRFRLCLKVQSREDSNEILRSPLAAEIREPGRAYLQVGSGEVFELFQSAYSGAPAEGGTKEKRPFQILRLRDDGRREIICERKSSEKQGSRETQLEVLVRHIRDHVAVSGIRRIPDICLPELPEWIGFPALISEEGSTVDQRVDPSVCALGILDDPDRQRQDIYKLDLARGNVLIVGSSRSGKTNLLQTVIRGLSTVYGPEDVQLYIIDFASMALRVFEDLSHVGGVVTVSDEEKIRNLFRLLGEEIFTRKKKLLEQSAGSFGAYRSMGNVDLPRMVLLIDGLNTLKELSLQENDALLPILREGPAVGITVVAAASQTTGIGYRYLTSFEQRIALPLNDQTEYGTLFDHCRERPAPLPGRALVEVDKRYLELQVYLAFEGAEEIRDHTFLTERRARGKRARPIPVVPETLTRTELLELSDGIADSPWQIPAGIDYGTVAPYILNLPALGFLGISGSRTRGAGFIRYLLETAWHRSPGGIEVYVADGPERLLADLSREAYTEFYDPMPDRTCDAVRLIGARLRERYDRLVEEGPGARDDEALLVLVLGSMEAAESIGADRESREMIRDMTGRYRHLGVCILFLVDDLAIPFSAGEVLKMLKEDRHVLYFGDLGRMKLFDVPLRALRDADRPMGPHDACYLRDGTVVRLMIPADLPGMDPGEHMNDKRRNGKWQTRSE